MPRRVGRACIRPGCRGIVVDDVCSVCGPLNKSRGDDALRGNARQRGYDWQWQKVRDMHIRNEPQCRRCNSTGGPGPGGLVVDHIVPLSEGGARLDDDNLQTLCARCHAAKHAEAQGRRG